ncbi:MAG TPA: GGDEF domain-containing protein [Acidobacteriaceae bacterium]
MPRSPLPRTLLSILPIFGALLAALAAHLRWPIPLSLLAMAVVASASAVIYWSAPLNIREPAEIAQTAEQAQPPALPNLISVLTAASQPQAAAAPSQSAPAPFEAGTVGTRADALITREPHETDLLTGLLGPEAFFARLARELDRCRVANQTAILVICDLDAFGEVNRTVGLADANRMLRQVADCFRLTVREGDVVSRLGGDEFGIFFPGLPAEVAENRVRDLRAAVRDAALLTLPEDGRQVTACIGTSCFPSHGDSVDRLMAAARLSLANARRERQENANKPIPSARVISRN